MSQRSTGCERASCTRSSLCKSARHLRLWSSQKNNLSPLLPSCPIHQSSVYAEFISLIRVDFMHDLSLRMFPVRITYQTTFLTHSEPEHFPLPPFLSLNRIHSALVHSSESQTSSRQLAPDILMDKQQADVSHVDLECFINGSSDCWYRRIGPTQQKDSRVFPSKGRCSADCNWSALHVHKHLRDAQFTADVSSSFVIFKSLLHALLFHLSCFNAVFM